MKLMKILMLMIIMIMGMGAVNALVADEYIKSDWRFDNVSDSSGYNFTLTNNGATSTSTGCNTGDCYDFDGSTDYISGASYDYHYGGGLTVNFWVNPDSVSGTFALINLDNGAFSGRVFRVWYQSSNLQFAIGDGASTYSCIINNGGTLTASTLQQITATYDGSNIRLYVDGSQVGSTVACSQSISSSLQTLYIGGGDGSATWLDGKIDDLSIIGKALNTTEISNISSDSISYVSSPKLSGLKAYWTLDNAFTDSTPFGNTLSNGGATYTPDGKIEGAYDFDGSTDYIGATMSDSLDIVNDQITLATWFKADTTTGTQRILCAPLNEASGTLKYCLFVQSGTIRGAINTAFGQITSQTVFTDTTDFHHIAITYDGGTQRLYLDGTLVDTDSNSGKIDPWVSGDLQLGRFGPSFSQNFNGIIDEVAIFDRHLDSEEISILYAENGGRSYDFTADAVSTPQIQLNISNGDAFNYTPINVSMTTSTIVNMSVYINGALNTTANNTASSSVLLGLEEGVNSLAFKSEDDKGVAWNNISITNDYTEPSIVQIANVSSSVFNVDFSGIVNVTDALSGLSSCTINITELENVTSPDNFLINCTDSQSFETAGLHNALVVATDNAGNGNTYSFNFTIQPFIYMRFNETGTQLFNYSVRIFHPDGRITSQTDNGTGVAVLSPVNNGSLDLGNHTIEFSKLGYELINVSYDVNESSANQNVTFNVPPAQIIFTFTDVDTGLPITGTPNVSIQIIGDAYANNFDTNESNLTVIDPLIFAGTYDVIVSKQGYETVSTEFDYTGQEILQIDIYFTPEDLNNSADLIVEVQDEKGDVQGKIVTLQYIWDSSQLKYILINQKTTDISGQTSYKVILNERKYNFCARYDGQLFCEEDLTININTDKVVVPISTDVLDGTDKSSIYQKSLTYSLSNQSTNISSLVTFTWNNPAQDIDQYCLEVTKIVSGQEQRLDPNGLQCSALHSGALTLNITFDNDTVYLARSKIYLDEERRVLYPTLRLNDNFSVQNALKDYGLHKLVAFALVLAGMAIGLNKKAKNLVLAHVGVSVAYLAISLVFPEIFEFDIFIVMTLINIVAVRFITKKETVGTTPQFNSIVSILFVYIVMIFAITFVLEDLQTRNLIDDRGEDILEYLTGADGIQDNIDTFLAESEQQLNITKSSTSPSGEDKTDNTLTIFIKGLGWVDTFFNILSKTLAIPETVVYLLYISSDVLAQFFVYINWIFNIVIMRVFYKSLFK